MYDNSVRKGQNSNTYDAAAATRMRDDYLKKEKLRKIKQEAQSSYMTRKREYDTLKMQIDRYVYDKKRLESEVTRLKFQKKDLELKNIQSKLAPLETNIKVLQTRLKVIETDMLKWQKLM